MMNQDATTLAKPAYALYVRLMQKAFCGSHTATTPKTTKAAFVEKGDAILCAKSKAVAAATKAISGEKTPSVKQLRTSFSGRCFQPSSAHMTTWRSWRFRRETRIRSQRS